MKKQRQTALSRSQSELCAGMSKFLTGEIERKRAEDKATERYRLAELCSLTRAPGQYAPSIKIFDGHGNQTKTLAIDAGELNQIIRILSPNKNWN